MQVKQQKKDFRSKPKPLQVGPSMLNKSSPSYGEESGKIEEKEMFSLGEGKGFVSDKSLVKKRYVGSLNKSPNWKREFKDPFSGPRAKRQRISENEEASRMKPSKQIFQLIKTKHEGPVPTNVLPDVPRFESNNL